MTLHRDEITKLKYKDMSLQELRILYNLGVRILNEFDLRNSYKNLEMPEDKEGLISALMAIESITDSESEGLFNLRLNKDLGGARA